MNNARSERGFTFVELMVVAVIVTILAMIATNAYDNYVARGKVQAAKADLTALASKLEDELQRNLVYTPHNNITTDAIRHAYKGWTPSQYRDFTYTLQSTPTTYTLKAQGINGKLSTCVLELNESTIGYISGCGAMTEW
ncbi:type IV pilin protein [Dyella flagellata]|nr:type IV pilin protein [Dyella flagellata]